jgi:hypothetical protein
MNKLRLEHQTDTGIRAEALNMEINFHVEDNVRQYIEWLEAKLDAGNG